MLLQLFTTVPFPNFYQPHRSGARSKEPFHPSRGRGATCIYSYMCIQTRVIATVEYIPIYTMHDHVQVYDKIFRKTFFKNVLLVLHS